MPIAYDDQLGEYFCTVCDLTLEPEELIFDHMCPGPLFRNHRME